MHSNEPGYFQRGKRRLGRNRRLPYVLGRQHVVFDAMYSHQILFFRPIRNHIKSAIRKREYNHFTFAILLCFGACFEPETAKASFQLAKQLRNNADSAPSLTTSI